MDDLFQWLRTTNDHLLIRSCVFHYEFEFIHPFSDGNGRTGRLWQSLLLGHLHPLFEHLPVENMVYSNQQAYYDAIGKSTHQATSTPFIEFMLDELLKTLKEHQGTPIMIGKDQRESVDEEFEAKFGAEFGVKFGVKFGVNEKRTLLIISENPLTTSALIASEIGISQRAVEKQIKKFRDLGLIHRVGSDKAGHWIINYK